MRYVFLLMLILLMVGCSSVDEVQEKSGFVDLPKEPTQHVDLPIIEEELCDFDTKICDNETFTCKQNGEKRLIKQCTQGCASFELCIEDFGKRVEGSCTNLVDNGEDTINLVIVGVSYDSFDQFTSIAKQVLYDQNSGLFSAEPFKSNKQKFNIWLFDTMQQKMLDLDILKSLVLNCNVENFHVTQLVHSEEAFVSTPDATFMPKPFSFTELPECAAFDYNEDGCVDPQDATMFTTGDDQMLQECVLLQVGCNAVPEEHTQVFVHEMGHLLGELEDEYVDGQDEGFHGYGGNCFSADSTEACLQTAPWKDLIGNGCGEEGKIDCTPDDPNYDLEVGCFEGCRYASSGVFRSTRESIMGSQGETFSFGLVNERLICSKIFRQTGSVGGYCDRFSG